MLTGSPLPLGNVRAPFLPVALAFAVLFQTLLLFAEVLFLSVDDDHGCGREECRCSRLRVQRLAAIESGGR